MREGFAPGESTGQYVRESHGSWNINAAVYTRAAQVTIDEQRLMALLGMGHSEVGGDSGFPFRRCSAGDHYSAQAAVEIGEQDGIAERADSLVVARDGAVRRGFGEHQRAPILSVRLFHPGQRADHLHVKSAHDLLWVAHGSIED